MSMCLKTPTNLLFLIHSFLHCTEYWVTFNATTVKRVVLCLNNNNKNTSELYCAYVCTGERERFQNGIVSLKNEICQI